MKHILILGSRFTGSKNDPRIIAQALEAQGALVRIAHWEELVITIGDGGVAINDASGELIDPWPDAVLAFGWYRNGTRSYYRDVALALGLYVESHGITIWNSEITAQRSTTKLSCLVALAISGVRVTPSRFSIDAERAGAGLDYPFVAKAIAASRGSNNFLVTSDVEKEALPVNVPMLLQPFIENSHDLRVICFGGQPALVLKRSRGEGASTHLNNTSQGAEAEWVSRDSVEPELLTIAAKICKITKREMAGIDFIEDGNSPYGYSCLEVNAIPQLTSGFDSAKKLAALTETLINQQP